MDFAALIRLGIIISLFLFLDWYTFQGIKTAISSVSDGIFGKFVVWFYWLLNLSVIIMMIAGTYKLSTDRENSYWFISIFLALFFLALIPKLVYSSILLFEDFGRMAYSLYDRVLGGNEKLILPGRRKFISQVGLGLATYFFGSILYGVTKGKYNYTVKNVEIRFPDLPAAFDGFTISQISDVHSGSFDNIDKVREGIKMINEQKSDIIVFTGDLVNSLASEIEPYVQYFKELEAPYGKFSILGNHDYASYHRFGSKEKAAENMIQLEGHHKEMGFDLLNNTHRIFEKDGASISLVGVENWGHSRHFPKRGDLDAALNGLDKNLFKVLLSHDPSHWEYKTLEHETHFPLTLSGHTHGGQFGIKIPGFRWSPIKYRYKRWAGLYTEGKQNLYVNQGFGYLAFPGRVGMPPEITVITLRSA